MVLQAVQARRGAIGRESYGHLVKYATERCWCTVTDASIAAVAQHARSSPRSTSRAPAGKLAGSATTMLPCCLVYGPFQRVLLDNIFMWGHARYIEPCLGNSRAKHASRLNPARPARAVGSHLAISGPSRCPIAKIDVNRWSSRGRMGPCKRGSRRRTQRRRPRHGRDEKTDVSSASSSVEGESRVEARLPEAQVLELFNAALERVAPCPASAAHTCCAGGRWCVKAPMRYDVREPTDLRRG
jgi:hypothetical protein